MTKKSFYENVINGIITDEMKEDAANYIAANAKTAEKRKAKRAEKSAEKAASYSDEILNVLMTAESPMTASQIGQAIETHHQAINGALAALTDSGQIKREYAKVGKRVATVYHIQRKGICPFSFGLGLDVLRLSPTTKKEPVKNDRFEKRETIKVTCFH